MFVSLKNVCKFDRQLLHVTTSRDKWGGHDGYRSFFIHFYGKNERQHLSIAFQRYVTYTTLTLKTKKLQPLNYSRSGSVLEAET